MVISGVRRQSPRSGWRRRSGCLPYFKIEVPYGSAASQSAADGSALQKEKFVRLLQEVTE